MAINALDLLFFLSPTRARDADTAEPTGNCARNDVAKGASEGGGGAAADRIGGALGAMGLGRR